MTLTSFVCASLFFAPKTPKTQHKRSPFWPAVLRKQHHQVSHATCTRPTSMSRKVVQSFRIKIYSSNSTQTLIDPQTATCLRSKTLVGRVKTLATRRLLTCKCTYKLLILKSAKCKLAYLQHVCKSILYFSCVHATCWKTTFFVADLHPACLKQACDLMTY